MKVRWLHRPQAGRLIGALLLLALVALMLSGCETETPQNTFAAKGEVAREQRDLFYLAMWPAIAIMILVEGALVVVLFRFRRRHKDELPKQVHGNTRLELAWTIAPAVLLLGLTVPMLSTLFDLGREPAADAFVVNVTGRQWAWFFEYPDIKGANGKPIQSTPGEVHFPAGKEIRFNIQAVDVIHSFWIPRLAGKLDAIPGEHHRMWIKADEPGSYTGQCAEFCGVGHADMKITAVVQSQDDFDAWAKEKQGGVKATGGAASPSSSP